MISLLQNALEKLKWEEQKELIDETVGLPVLNKYPLQTKYVIRFLRHIIDSLESQNLDIHDDLYTKLCEYQSQTIDTSSPYSYKHYQIDNNNETVVLKENDNKISEGTTGLNVWESALVLSEMALSTKPLFRGKNCLELGAGTGLSSLVIGKCCDAKSIKVTDGNHKVIEILHENFGNNFDRTEHDGKFVNTKSETQIGSLCSLRQFLKKNHLICYLFSEIVNLDWLSEDECFIIENFSETELIIAADIIYDNSLFEALLTTVVSIFKHSPRCEKFILVNAVRNPDTEREFLDMLGEIFILNVTSCMENSINFYFS